jgi:hypothetical protein
MAWMVFWLSAILSLVMVVKGPEEYRLLAIALVAASAAWLAGSYIWNQLMRRRRRSRHGRSSSR